MGSRRLRLAWIALVGAAVASRVANALLGPVLSGYDALGHVSYVFFLDLYRAVPYADQGWSYFHPPLHYLIGWLLAQSGSADVLVRGLALLGSAASLAIAGLSARVTRLGLPGHPGLALLAFCAVAFLPAQVYASPMPGNELTAAALAVAGIAVLLAGERRPSPSRLRDAGVGALLGAALLAKFSAAVPLAALLAYLPLRGLRGQGLARVALRVALLGGTAALVGGACYARNASELGTPFPLRSSRPLVDLVESAQPPGERSWRDFVAVSPRLFVDPDPRAPHLLHSVWGTLYVTTWVDTRRGESDLSTRWARALLLLGLAPSALAAAGLYLSLRRAARRDAPADLLLVLLTGAGLASFALFAWRIPTYAALKATYLLYLSPAYAYFLARSLAALAPRPHWRALAAASVALAALASAFAYTRGIGLPGHADNAQMAAVRAYFGDCAGARAIYRRELGAGAGGTPAPQTFSRRVWLPEALAALELAAGRPAAARDLHRESVSRAVPQPGLGGLAPRRSPQVANRLAVATALAGDPSAALQLLDRALAEQVAPELLANRAALRARAGELEAAAADLERALELSPRLVPALHTRAWILGRMGARADAEAARRQALGAARLPPRDFPYGVGDGRGLNSERPLLVLGAEGLALYRPPRTRPCRDGEARP